MPSDREIMNKDTRERGGFSGKGACSEGMDLEGVEGLEESPRPMTLFAWV